jgi:CBS domain containing-hemolysin-like protein
MWTGRLAAILSLNTMAHTLGAAGAGAEAARIWGSDKLAIASAVLTLLILVLSELIPKTLGAVYWQRFVVPVAYVLPPMIKLMLPLVWLSDLITMAIKRGREPTPSISRAEIAAMAGLAEAGGTIDPTESRILRSLIHCGTLRARDIMTPRTVVFWLDEKTTLAEVLDKPGAMNFSRIPVGRATRHKSWVVTGKPNRLLGRRIGAPPAEAEGSKLRMDSPKVPACRRGLRG